MEITVRGKHLEVSEQVVERARRKLARLPHYLPLLDGAVAEIDVVHERAKEPSRRYAVYATVKGNGVHLRAEEYAEKPEAAIDHVARVLEEQARRHKERLYGRNRQSGSKRAPPQPADEAEQELPGSIGRVKRFSIKPMTVHEAVEEMQALGHDFFLFFDADAEGYALMYRRRSGDYGLIVPELA